MDKKRKIPLVAIKALWKHLAVKRGSSVITKAAVHSQVVLFFFFFSCLPTVFLFVFFMFVWRKKKGGNLLNIPSSFYLCQLFSLLTHNTCKSSAHTKTQKFCSLVQVDSCMCKMPDKHSRKWTPCAKSFKGSWLVNWVLSCKFTASGRERSENGSIHPCLTFKAKTLLQFASSHLCWHF